jgi:Rab GDP dissociation inhibitor
LLGWFEAYRFKDFLTFVSQYDVKNPKTHHGVAPDMPTAQMMKKYNLDDSTMDLVGHSLALYLDESWKTEPAKNVIERVVLYGDSLRSYGKSPYLYPVYGLGDLPQSFARLSAIYGGTYMLNTKVDGFTFDESGKVNGVKSGDQVAKCSMVIGDPSYFPDRVQKIGDVVRCIAILDHPVEFTDKAESLQIIIPQNQVKRKHDIYVSVVSFAHNVAPKGKYLAIVSTTVETPNPQAELEPGLKWLGKTLHRFYKVHPIYAPKNDSVKEAIHISKSYDATSHFDTMADDVIRLYKAVTGEADVSYILKPKDKPAGTPKE